MQHVEAIRTMASEKYLLNELTPEQRDEFEEHFFGCPECALEVRTGASFIEHSKIILSEPAQQQTAAVAQVPQYKGWFGWLRPAIAMPILALLLVVVGYQSYSAHFKTAGAVADLSAPQILPSASLVSARSDKVPALAVHPDQSFLLFVDIPSDSRFGSYICEMYAPGGDLAWSLPVSAEAAKNTLPLHVPSGNATPGAYSLVVRGLASDGSKVELARYPFELQTQN